MRITAEQVLEVLERSGRRAWTPKSLLRELHLHRHQLRELRRVLRELLREGRVERLEGRYRARREDGLVEATLHRAPEGDRVADDAGSIHPVASGADGGGDGDRVLVQLRADGRADVIHVLTPHRPIWVGILDREATGGFVTPYRDDASWGIRVDRADCGEARDGDVVVVTLRGRRRGQPMGRVVEVLGPPGSPEADFRAVVWRRRLPVEFPEDVLAEAERWQPGIEPGELERRSDLRDKPFITIDPATARDHDDAVCVEPLAAGGVRLSVAIADVSHFVPEGSALDREALRRGNSVYFPDRAIPMLPERLSGDLCSLRPEVDRYAMCAELEIQRDGSVAARFHSAVIRSRARLDYETAAEEMEGREPAGLAPEVRDQLRRLAELSRSLREQRVAAGSIDFELPAALVVLDAEGMPVDVVQEPRSAAHRAIEEAMLAANRAVSATLTGGGAAALFRVHETPSPADAEDLRELLASFGLLSRRRHDGPLAPAEVAEALRRVEGRPEERLVNMVALRAMKRARYADRDIGHFALAFESYTHFTSPIRRYADLVVHRALRDLLEGGAEAEARAARRGQGLAALAARVSMRERIAEAAEREMVDLKKCAFMAERVGEEYDGTISGVARHGFYVTLDPFFVEGLVHVATLEGYAQLDERAHALVIRGTRRRFRLGDRVRVRVDGVDRVKAWINLGLVAGASGNG